MSSTSLLKRILQRKPSLAMMISLIALFFAMSGTAVAATGGSFLLGKSNTATSITSLTNTKGTALSLSSSSGTPPLRVSNSVQVPKLNASELGGKPASAFLPATGTAANASQLGGIAASGFMQGDGSVSGGRNSVAGTGSVTVASAPGSHLVGNCDIGTSGSTFAVFGTGEATWWSNTGGGSGQTSLSQVQAQLLPGSGGFTSPVLLTVQVDTGSNIETYTATANYDFSSSTCSFTAQVVTTNG